MRPTGTDRPRDRTLAATPIARLCLLALSLLALSSCYFGLGAGAAFPAAGTAPREPTGAGTVVAADGGFQYDHRRLVRVLAFGSWQLSGGVPFELRGQSVLAPYGAGFGLDVTLRRAPDSLWRIASRVWPLSQPIQMGPADARSQVPDSGVRTGFLGLTWQALGDRPDIGPIGASFMAGVLVQRVTAPPLGKHWVAGPMLMMGVDWSWHLFHCLVVNTDCPENLLHLKQ